MIWSLSGKFQSLRPDAVQDENRGFARPVLRAQSISDKPTIEKLIARFMGPQEVLIPPDSENIAGFR